MIKEDSLLSLTILIDFFQIALYLTLFVLKRYLVSGFIAAIAIISRVFQFTLLSYLELFIF